jgi:membrane-associated protein
MDIITQLIDFFLHIDEHLNEVIAAYGLWTYLILFAIVFFETGIVVTPFLPGDSLLFAAGAFAASGSLEVGVLLVLLMAAAIIGDSVNYYIGSRVGTKVFQRDDVRFLNKRHLERTHAFYERHGGKTIIIARFVPIVRTFAPFVAGIGSMSYGKFLTYNVVGAVLWVSIFVVGGYLFGNLPFVEDNFSIIIVVIVLISVMPAVVEYLRQRLGGRGGGAASDSAAQPPAERGEEA